MDRQFTLFRLFVVSILLIAGAPAAALDAYFSGFGTASLSCFSSDTAAPVAVMVAAIPCWGCSSTLG